MIQPFIDLHFTVKHDDTYYYSLKTAFLKLLSDKGYYFDVQKHISEIMKDFTFDCIISCWMGHEVKIFNEPKRRMRRRIARKIRAILNDESFSFRYESENILADIYRKVYLNQNIKYDLHEYMADMLRNEIEADDKFIDPICGAGSNLSVAYDAMMNLYYQDNANIPIENIHNMILEDCLFGIDASEIACLLTKIILALKHKNCVISQNIFTQDSLKELPTEIETHTFDWVSTDLYRVASTRTDIKKIQGLTIYDHFFETADTLLKNTGKLVFSAQPEIQHMKYAQATRERILNDFTIKSVLEFPKDYKGNPQPLIYCLGRTYQTDSYVNVKKFLHRDNESSFKGSYLYEDYYIKQDTLVDTEIDLRANPDQSFAYRIEALCPLRLKDIIHFFQGIITGCDKAFVVENDSIIYPESIKECGVPWIKGKDIDDQIQYYGHHLLYTNGIDFIEQYPNTQKRLDLYRNQLEDRRECMKGVRKWYELQWGRDKQLFLQDKFVFPANSDRNRFVYDNNGYFFSADIYGGVLLDEIKDEIEIEKLLLLLNSEYYDQYIKTKLSKNEYDSYMYYPNLIKDVKIPSLDIIRSFEKESDISNYFNGTDRREND